MFNMMDMTSSSTSQGIHIFPNEVFDLKPTRIVCPAASQHYLAKTRRRKEDSG